MIRRTILTALYRYASRALCRERGHDWREIDVTVTGTTNAGPVEECRTCERRRLKPFMEMDTTSNTYGITIEQTGGPEIHANEV